MAAKTEDRRACKLLIVLIAFCCLPSAVGQQSFRLKTCSSAAPRQHNWVAKNKTFASLTATNLVDGNLKAHVGPVLNCPGENNDCHSWGEGFGDRNGVMYLNGSASSFRIDAWPLADIEGGPSCAGGG